MKNNKSLNQFELKSPLLPNQIASRILDLELDYESKSLSKQHLLQLLRLYSQAIEFYEQNNDKKHIIFQTRLSNVLKNPYSISILEEQAPNKIKQKQISELTKTAQYGSGQQAHQLLSSFMNQKSKVQSKIIKEIESQKSKIIRRLMNKSFTKSFVTVTETNCSQGDAIDLMETEKQWRLAQEKEQRYGVRLEEHKLKQENKQDNIVKVQNNFLSFMDSKAAYLSPQKKNNVKIASTQNQCEQYYL